MRSFRMSRHVFVFTYLVAQNYAAEGSGTRENVGSPYIGNVVEMLGNRLF